MKIKGFSWGTSGGRLSDAARATDLAASSLEVDAGSTDAARKYLLARALELRKIAVEIRHIKAILAGDV